MASFAKLLQYFWPRSFHLWVFAWILEKTRPKYESIMEKRKLALFKKTVSEGDTVIDIGIGTGPNLKYVSENCKVIGLEPNKYMWPYVKEKAEKLGTDVRLIPHAGESMPLDNESADVVVSTLTMCSVESPERVVKEILRVLKPGGFFLFIEHTLSPNRPVLRFFQWLVNPFQRFFADGCRTNQDTERIIRETGSSGFDKYEIDRFEFLIGNFFDFFNIEKPHIAGYARKAKTVA